MRSGDGKLALVTGANRGIGYEVARQLGERGYRVLLCSRDADAGRAAVTELAADGLVARQLDVTDPASVERLTRDVADEPGRLDVLVNNAAILYDTWQRAVDADLDVVRRALDTNLLGAWRMCEAFIPLIRAGGRGAGSSTCPAVPVR